MQSGQTVSENENSTGSRPLRVCFVVLDAYPAIDPRVEGGIGGVETRSWMLARALAQKDDYQVSFRIRHHQPVSQTEYDGVRLLPVSDRYSRLRTELSRKVIRTSRFPFVSVRGFSWSMIWQLPLLAVNQWTRPQTHSSDLRPVALYTNIDAEVLVCFGVNAVSASVIASAKASGKKSVLLIASDIDLDERYTADSDYVNIYHSPAKLCHYAVTHADQVIVQTPDQLKRLETNFERPGEVIGNPIDLEEWDARLQSAELPAEIQSQQDYVLWVGRAERHQKQPQLMPELARACPELPFLMIMNPSDRELERQVRADAPQNLQIVEKIPFDQMPAVYGHASVLVNTSSSEGFPNTFLQAAASGVPVASLCVGQDFLQDSGAGHCAGGSLERLAELLPEVIAGDVDYDPELARRYVCDHHSLTAQAERVAETLNRLTPDSHE